MTRLLEGLTVLVTRPQHQAENLMNLIHEAGGESVLFPVINIVEMADNTALYRCRDTLHTYNIAIFTSANAVHKAVPHLLTEGDLPDSLQIFAIGKRTAQVLKEYGVSAYCAPAPYNSEALLSIEAMQAQVIKACQCVIFRGEGGRDKLANTLHQRGAKVDYVSVYRRILPNHSPQITKKIDAVVVTSVESLHNLFTLAAAQLDLVHLPLIVMSQRMVNTAIELGITAPIMVAPAASDQGLLDAIMTWHTQYNG